MRPLARPLVAALAAVALLASACGGGDAAADDPPSTTTAPADQEPDATEPPTEGEGDEAADDGPPVPSPGCEAGAPTTEVVTERHEVDGQVDPDGAPRRYLLTAPEGDEPLPLVLDFHGLSEGAEIHALMSEVGELGLDEGFATVFPQGTGQPVGWRAGDLDSPDLAYVDALLDQVGAERCIDTSRTYATGLSNGAMMTSLLACTRADRIAAFVPVAGLLLPDGCDPARPVPLLALHGTADPILYFNGGVGDLSIVDGGEAPDDPEVPEADLDGEGYPATARAWAELQGCDPEATDTERAPGIIDRTWDCPDGAEVHFTILEGQGHGWPGSQFARGIADIVGPTIDGVHASDDLWEFSRRHQLTG